MDDLISRQAAIDYCYALINAENPSDPSDEWNYSQERINQTEVILYHLEFMPSAQPEIIRCKDCKYWNPHYAECEGIGNWFGFEGAWSENGYCYKAERRTDG